MIRSARPTARATCCSSRLIAVVLLAIHIVIGGPADVVGAVPVDLPHDLARLSEGLRAQIGRTYRLNHYARDRQLAQVDRALGSWQASGHQVQDEEILGDWLRDAIRRSAPVRRLPLSPVPSFAHRPAHPSTADFLPATPHAGNHSSQHSRRPPPQPPIIPVILEGQSLRIRDASPLGAHRNLVQHTGAPLPTNSAQPPPRRFVPATLATTPPIALPVLFPAVPFRTVDSAPMPPHQVAEKQVVVSTSPPSVTPLATPAQTSVPRPGRMAGRTFVTKINLTEYRARTVGYRRGIRRVEAKLVSGEAQTARELMRLAQELDALADQRALLEIYSNLIGGSAPRELAQILPSPRPARKLLQKAADRRRDALRQPGLLPTLRDRQLELSILSAAEQRSSQE